MSGRQRVEGPELAKALLHPKSVALFGVSDDPRKTAGRPLRYLRQAGFGGIVYCVNPRRETVQGEPAYPSLADLPEVPDHAFILTDTKLAMEAVAECGRLGVSLATILSTGFSESGPEGTLREAELLRLAQHHGVRLLGPSSLGVVNVPRGLLLTANAAFAEPDVPSGGIFCASHSGSLIGALASRGRARGIGFHSFVSVGSEVDLTVGEICAATLSDSSIDGYLLFLESTRHAPDLRAFAIEAAKRGKPVAAYKLGRSAVAAELAVSHTGALSGEDDIADILLTESGIARVETFEGLLEIMPLLKRLPLKSMPRHGRVGVVTTTGGGAAMAVDQLGIRGVAVVGPTEETLARLHESGVKVAPGRIIDLTLAGTRYEVMKRTIDVMLEAPEFDIVLAAVGSSARAHPELAVKPVIDSSGTGKPLACFIVPEAPEALERLAQANVPAFRTPESCGDVIAAALRRGLRTTESVQRSQATSGKLLDEAQSYELLDRVGVAHMPVALLEPTDAEPTLPFPYPVAVKILSAALSHKTDVGGVVLNVGDSQALRDAMMRIRDNLARHAPHVSPDRFLVQPMSEGLGEVLVGYQRDPEVGPLVMLAAGGVLTEIYRDRCLRLAPVDYETAQDMIRHVKALTTLSGYRGQAAGDLDALSAAIVAMSKLAKLTDITVLDAEINPLIVRQRGQGVLAVDALVRIAED